MPSPLPSREHIWYKGNSCEDCQLQHNVELLMRQQRVSEELMKRQATNDEQIDELNRKVDEQGRQLAEQKRLLAKQGRLLAKQGRQLGERKRLLAKQGRLLAKERRQLAEQGRQLAEQGRQLAEQERQLGLLNQLEGNAEKLGEHRRKLCAHEESIASLTNKQKASASQHLELKGSIEELTDKLSAIQTDLDAVKEGFRETANQISHSSQHDDFYIQVEFLQKALEEVKGRLDVSTTHIELIAKNFAKICNDLDRCMTDIHHLREEADESRDRVATTEGQCEELNRSLEAIREKVAREEGFLKSKLSSIQEQVYDLCRLVNVNPEVLLGRTLNT